MRRRRRVLDLGTVDLNDLPALRDKLLAAASAVAAGRLSERAAASFARLLELAMRVEEKRTAPVPEPELPPGKPLIELPMASAPRANGDSLDA